MDKGTCIGYLTACIAGDHRYSSRIDVILTGDKATVTLSENGAIGGMDGPGGSYGFSVTAKRECIATPSNIVKLIKATMDNVIKTYGKPTKYFTWVGVSERGLSVARCQKAIAYATSDEDT